ncbi:MAG: hypothetical protein AAB677_02775 [Patescibacteria group bacterium]
MMSLRFQWLGLVVLVGGCGNWPPPLVVDRDVVVTGDLDVQGEFTAASGEIGGVEIADDNVDIPGDVAIGDDLNVGGSVTIGGGDDIVVIPPPPPVPPVVPPLVIPPPVVPPPSVGELEITLAPPFVGLAEEGLRPIDCTAFTAGNFGIEVKVKIEGGIGPFAVRFRNYYGSGTNQSGAGREFTFVFDASVPTTECVSSQIRVTDIGGRVRNLFFYLRVD